MSLPGREPALAQLYLQHLTDGHPHGESTGTVALRLMLTAPVLLVVAVFGLLWVLA